MSIKPVTIGDQNANGLLIWESFCYPRTIEVNYLFGAMLPKPRLYQGAGIKKSNEAGENLPRELWSKNVG